ncbi:MAG: hypothetical protein GX197_05000 [Firmicutes bacterium]|nr:hypothetical protein [Bacillota bacterium]
MILRQNYRAVPVGDRHVHYLQAVTTIAARNRHHFRAATLIEDATAE